MRGTNGLALHDHATEELIATLLTTKRGALALFQDGHVGTLGTAADDVPGLVCLQGEKVTPWERCAAAFHDPGALRRHLQCR